ncbi:hypothetical protein ACQBAU_11590 [Propionibacteriaceae bacterium Y2011]
MSGVPLTGGLALSGPLPLPLHGIASRHDLPLPFEFVVVGAVVALVVSFVLLFFGWPKQRYRDRRSRGLFRVHPAVVWVARIAVLLWYGVAALALVAGEDRLTNPIFGFVFALLWVGLVPLSALFGPVYAALNPVATLQRLVYAVLRRDPDDGFVTTVPKWLGVWPGAVGLFVFTFFELVQPARTTLPVMQLYVAGWFVVLFFGSLLGGRRWLAAADPFEVFANLVAAGAPLQPDKEGRVQLINPLRALATWRPPNGTPAVVSVLLGSTAFDSFANTSWWLRTVQDSSVPYEVWATGGLLTMIILVATTFWLAARLMTPFSRRGVPVRELARLMSPSIVPIIVGYAIAHYFTLLVVEGQRTVINMSDPLGLGWNLFGTAERGVATGLVMVPTFVAVLQLAGILLGHIVGIVVAHERSLAMLRPDRTIVGQLPMLLVMIGYTIAGLLLLFSP